LREDKYFYQKTILELRIEQHSEVELMIGSIDIISYQVQSKSESHPKKTQSKNTKKERQESFERANRACHLDHKREKDK
jgi:hypothetical protein